MMQFERLTEGIYRLCVPFERIDTAVFALIAEKGTILLDGASSDADVEQYILPALANASMIPDVLLYSHHHDDHVGGMRGLSRHYPRAEICMTGHSKWGEKVVHPLFEGEVLFERFSIVFLPGHTKDCLGVWDAQTHTLISCDAIQQRGIDRFPTSAENLFDYERTLDRVKQMHPHRILFSHDYDPFGRIVEGDEAIERCLEISRRALIP